MADRVEILTLHRYFIWADRMRVHFDSLLNSGETATEMMHMHPYLAYWYAETFVVIEGWQELGLSDPEIDALPLTTRNASLALSERGISFSTALLRRTIHRLLERA